MQHLQVLPHPAAQGLGGSLCAQGVISGMWRMMGVVTATVDSVPCPGPTPTQSLLIRQNWALTVYPLPLRLPFSSPCKVSKLLPMRQGMAMRRKARLRLFSVTGSFTGC